MTALCAELGNPERAYRSLHVVGTNGKTSVTLMCAALLGAAGIRTGACVSPHLWRWSERTRIDGAEVGRAAFADAVAEVAAGIDRVEAADAEARVTQFEAAIAASLVAFRDADVEVAVVEAGLGGRLDATNVIASSATALTSVALDHTDWLGDTVEQIAAEKLAVLEPGTPLIGGRLGERVDDQAAAWAERLGSPYRRAAEPDPEAVPAAMPPYLRRDAAVAIELATTVTERRPSAAASRRALAGLRLAGRAERIEGDPPLIADAAHNEEGAAALAEALAATTPAPRIACVSVLADKDAAAIAAALAGAIDHVVCTAAEPGAAMGRPGAEALDPAALAARFEQVGVGAEVVPAPEAALARALALASESDGVAVCAGSNYLLRYAWTVRHDQSCSR